MNTQLKYIPLFLVLIAFTACNSKSKSAAADSAASNAAQTQATPFQKFKQAMDGSWVVSGYITSLAKTRSPYNSRHEFSMVAAMSIGLSAGAGDSAHIGYSLNNHEGGDFIVYNKLGQRPNALKTKLIDGNSDGGFYELGYSIKNSDTSVIVYHYNKNKGLADSVSYTKVITFNDTDASGGIEYITNKMLFSGTYTIADTVAGLEVKLEDNGKISGLSDFKTYLVNTDFVAGPENNLDEIIFDWSTKKQKSYAFKFNKDTLNMYETKEAADSINLVVDKLKYKLVKHK